MRLQVARPVISFCEFHGFLSPCTGFVLARPVLDEPHAILHLANEPHTRREKVFCAPQTVTFTNMKAKQNVDRIECIIDVRSKMMADVPGGATGLFSLRI